VTVYWLCLYVAAVVGAVVYAVSATCFLLGAGYWNFLAGMILLGLGWNLSFSAGTVMLIGKLAWPCTTPYTILFIQGTAKPFHYNGS
jgi:hypothetical protein